MKKHFRLLLFPLAVLLISSTSVSCQTLNGGRDSVNDASLYRSQDRAFRPGGY